MIVKKVPNPDKTATKRVRITRLLEYIRTPERDDATEKCIHYGTRGFASDDPADQIAEMAALAQTARRSRDPTNHYVASWPAGERPTPAQVDEAIDIFRQELDIPDLLVAYALHADTENWHAHIVVLRVDPETGKPVQIQKGFDLDAAQRAGALIEHKQGWRATANKRWVVIDGRIAPADPNPQKPDRPRPKEPHERRQPPQRQRDMAHRTEAPSVTQRLIGIVAPILDQDLPSGPDGLIAFHTALEPHGVTHTRRGGGAVFTLGDVTVKASSVDRRATLTALEKRFGLYKAHDQAHDPDRAPPAHPLDARPLFADKERRAQIQDWPQLHTALAAYRLRIERKGSGALICSADHDRKASDVHRNASLTRLEKALGPYKPRPPDLAQDQAPTPDETPPAPEPPDPAAAKPTDLAQDQAPTPDETPPAPEPPDLAAAKPIIAAARSWKDLHTGLAAIHGRYQLKGSGATISVGSVTVKASQVSRKATLAALERRFGAPYQPPPDLDRQPGTATPAAAVVADPDQQAYAAERAQYRRAEAAARIAYQQDYDRKLATLKAKQAAERKAALAGKWKGRGDQLNKLRGALRLLHDAQLIALRDERRKAAEKHRRDYPPWPDIKPGLQNSWVIPGAPAGRPEPVAGIHAYTARIARIGVAYAHRDRQGRPDFLDTGPEIRFLRRSSDDPEAMRAAVQLIVAKGTRRIRIHAKDREFIRLAIASLVEHGIKVTNPELRDQVIAEQKRQARAAAEHQPPTAAPSTPDPAVATPEAAPVAGLPPVKMVLVPADGPGIFRHDYDARPPEPAVPLAGYRAERQSDTGSVSYIRDGSDDVVAVDRGGALLLTSACRDQDVLRAVLGLADARFTAGIACSKSPAPTVMGDEHAKWVEAIQYWSARDKRHLVDPEPPQLATSFPRLHRPPKTQLAETPVARTRPRGAERD